MVAVGTEEGLGAALVARLRRAHPGNTVGLHSEAVTPAEIVGLIREAKRAGWQAEQPGPAFFFEPSGRVALPGPEIRSSPRLSLAQIENMARSRPVSQRDKIRLTDTPGRLTSGIEINGVDLLSWVREAEMPFGIREAQARRESGGDAEPEHFAGAYVGLGVAAFRWPSRVLLDAPQGHAGHFVIAPADPRRQKATVLGCPCGILECWFFLVRISILDDLIVWSEFECFHRSDWCLNLGPFIFEREGYLAALGAPEDALE